MNSTKTHDNNPSIPPRTRQFLDSLHARLTTYNNPEEVLLDEPTNFRLADPYLEYLSSQIKDSYANNPQFRDLHSKTARILKLDPILTIELYKRDFELHRLSVIEMREFELLLARNDQMDDAITVIESHYKLDPKATDRFARTADACFTPKKAFNKLQGYIDNDKKFGRNSWFCTTMEARQAAINGDLNGAINQLNSIHESGKGREGLFEKLARSLMWLWMFDRARELLNHEIAPSPNFQYISTLCSQIKAIIEQSIKGYPSEIRPLLEGQLKQLHASGNKVEILNATIYFASRYDILHLFHEVVLFQPYQFSSTKKKPYIIDAGSNCGVALAYFKYLYPEAEIEAFEPQPHLTSLLQKTIRHNDWENVTLHSNALSSDTGQEATLQTKPGNEMGASLLKKSTLVPDAPGTVLVSTESLNPFLERPVDFLKLDIEGCEAEVLQCAGSRLQNVKQGFIEYHYNSNSSNNDLSTVTNALEQNGFTYSLEMPVKRVPNSVSSNPRGKIPNSWSLSIFFKKP